jgi:hypothetical protein
MLLKTTDIKCFSKKNTFRIGSGYSTQLPGVAFGHFLYLGHFRHLQQSGFLAKFIAGVAWLAFTTVLWPTPFLRAGLNMLAIELIVAGLLGSVLLVTVADTLPWIAAVAVGVTVLSLALAQRRGLRG